MLEGDNGTYEKDRRRWLLEVQSSRGGEISSEKGFYRIAFNGNGDWDHYRKASEKRSICFQ